MKSIYHTSQQRQTIRPGRHFCSEIYMGFENDFLLLKLNCSFALVSREFLMIKVHVHYCWFAISKITK